MQISKGMASLNLLLVTCIALVVAGVVFGVTYHWQHDQVNSLSRTTTGLNSQISVLNQRVMIANQQISTLLNKPCQQLSSIQPVCQGYDYTSVKGVSVLIFTPVKNTVIASPVGIIGEIPGSWSFEAQFPVQLKDGTGHIVTQVQANVLGNWQTNQLQPFSARLVYTDKLSGNGSVVLKKDNPSGLPANDDSITIPVRF